MNDNVHYLQIEKRRRRRGPVPALPRADVYQLKARRSPAVSGQVQLPNSREEVQAMFDELAHHLLLTIRVITARLR
ncbi:MULTISPECIES: hypothetical protein [Paraburkholderia]|jgi:hypothetical protein|uniref:Uncharacterized protein n=1 Tax=Paraburkholderia fynbosensis TaxID=1200993 RepID=A0A6J5FKD3_9BURK|nr:hypothetical protein [Paraburkholderia fynbosensis]CAB3782149.1 hypothetical protein LMG27177_01178 [Paraburkholderia fynbosensis]